MHDQYVSPSRELADLIVPGHGDNQVVVQILARAFEGMVAGAALPG